MSEEKDNVYDFMSRAKDLHLSNNGREKDSGYDSKSTQDLLFNCTDCMNNLPEGLSPSEYGRLWVGLVRGGTHIRVECGRGHGVMGDFELAEPIDDKECSCDSHE